MKVEINFTVKEKNALKSAIILLQTTIDSMNGYPADRKDQQNLQLAEQLLWRLVNSYATFDWEVAAPEELK